jgi:chromatin segregation and condensation protein Rec8/ScpA/Scc1 (kleisin family)
MAVTVAVFMALFSAIFSQKKDEIVVTFLQLLHLSQ